MTRHPARYSDVLMPLFYLLLRDRECILDPFAGTGKLVRLYDYGYEGILILNELEKEWAQQTPMVKGGGPEVHVGDARKMVYLKTSSVDAICTSPTYGNRMGDDFEASNPGGRNTYRHALGKPLTEGNTGGMLWGLKYKEVHQAVWKECWRVLRPGGRFILNVSDHIRGGKRQHVSAWHVQTLCDLGFFVLDWIRVGTPRLRHGAHHDRRVGYESIFELSKYAGVCRRKELGIVFPRDIVDAKRKKLFGKGKKCRRK